MDRKRALTIMIVAAIYTALGFAGGYYYKTFLDLRQEEWPLLAQAYDILERHALEPLPTPPALEYGMIRGMLQAYDDPYTSFVEPVQHELERDTLVGHFGGIGVRLGRDPENYIVMYPFPEGPAAGAGIQDGDRLLQVEDQPVTPETKTEEVQAAVRGPVGRVVRITFGRPPDYIPQERKIKRAEIALPSVTWHLDAGVPSVGVVEINVIAASTPEEVEKAIADLQARGAAAFVLDLRDNFGGLLTAGVETAELFLREGTVIEQQYRGREVETFRLTRPGPLASAPLAVVVNQHTASAAEIIAGALRAHQRALLVGSKTFGKDSIQLVFDLKDGSSLHVTAARWWVPNLTPPIGAGLEPDVPVSPPEDDSGPDPAIQAAIELLLP